VKKLRRFREKGYDEGFHYGYLIGSCFSIMRSVPVGPTSLWKKRILYVTSGKGLPYTVLDAAISESVRAMVKQLIVTSPGEDVAELAKSCRPDLVFVFDGMDMPIEQVKKLRELGFKTAVWFADDPYYFDVTEKLAVHYDHVFTLELNCVSHYQNIGCADVHYLPLAVNPSAFRPRIVPRGERRELVFIGSAFWNRVRLFDSIAPFLASKNVSISGNWWKIRLRKNPLLASKIENKHWKTEEETAAYYSGAQIVLNVHRAFDDYTFNRNSRRIAALSPNPRTFEIACCGTLQMTDMRSDLSRFYIPGKEIVTFSGAEDLKSKIDYYLRHEDERREIALRALTRTLREHTYTRRLERMLEILFGPGESVLHTL